MHAMASSTYLPVGIRNWNEKGHLDNNDKSSHPSSLWDNTAMNESTTHMNGGAHTDGGTHMDVASPIEVICSLGTSQDDDNEKDAHLSTSDTEGSRTLRASGTLEQRMAAGAQTDVVCNLAEAPPTMTTMTSSRLQTVQADARRWSSGCPCVLDSPSLPLSTKEGSDYTIDVRRTMEMGQHRKNEKTASRQQQHMFTSTYHGIVPPAPEIAGNRESSLLAQNTPLPMPVKASMGSPAPSAQPRPSCFPAGAICAGLVRTRPGLSPNIFCGGALDTT